MPKTTVVIFSFPETVVQVGKASKFLLKILKIFHPAWLLSVQIYLSSLNLLPLILLVWATGWRLRCLKGQELPMMLLSLKDTVFCSMCRWLQWWMWWWYVVFFWLGRGSKVVIALLVVIPCVPGAKFYQLYRLRGTEVTICFLTLLCIAGLIMPMGCGYCTGKDCRRKIKQKWYCLSFCW